MERSEILKAKRELKKKVASREPQTEHLVTKEILGLRKRELEKRINTENYKEMKEKYSKDDKTDEEFVRLGIAGLDDLFKKGVPKGSSVLIAGSAGTGKTIFCLQMLHYAVKNGEKCLYLSFEESEERLKQHMKGFGWDSTEFEKKGLLIIKRVDPFEISKSIEALLAQAKGELLIEVEGLSGFIPEGFKPDRIFIDSVTALTA